MEQIINSRGTGLDRDSSIQNMAPGDSDYRLNCIYDVSDDSALGDVQNVRSNVKRNYTQPPGDNLTIGSCKDLERNAIIYFVWNSLGWHEIRRFFVDTKLTQTILRHPILNFQRNKKITGANVVQDLLYWTDGHDNGFQDFNPPRKLNLERAAAFTASAWYFTDNGFFSGNVGFVSNVPHGLQVGDVIMIDQFAGFSNASYNGQTTVTAVPNPTTIVTGIPFGVNTPPQGGTIHLATSLEYWRIDNVVLDRIKHPPLLCPTFTIESENNDRNLLYGSLFQFMYRYIYDDYEQSVFSPFSKLTLFQNEDSDGNYLGNTDNRIDVTYETGHETVRQVEIAIKTRNSFKVVSVIEKFDSIGNVLVPSNISRIYNFYNDSIVRLLDDAEVLKPFDFSPQISQAQELIEKNRIVDGNITEGYDNIDIDISLSSIVRKVSDTPSDVRSKYLTFRRKGAHLFGIRYSDRAGRSSFVQINDSSRFDVPYWYDKDLINQYYNIADQFILSTNQRASLEWSINHIPPEWAESYEIVMTRDIYNSNSSTYFVQWGCGVGDDEGIHNLGKSSIKVPVNIPYSFSEGDRIRLVGVTDIWRRTYDPPQPQVSGPFSSAYVLPNRNTFVVGDNLYPPFYGIGINDVYKTDPNFEGRFWLKGEYDHRITGFDTSTGVLKFQGEMEVQSIYSYVFQIYRPIAESSDPQFFGIGETYRIIDPGTPTRRHQGQIQDQSSGMPAMGVIDGVDCIFRRKRLKFENDRYKFNVSWVLNGSAAVPSAVITDFRVNGGGASYLLSTNSYPWDSSNPDWQNYASLYPSLPLYTRNNVFQGGYSPEYNVDGIGGNAWVAFLYGAQLVPPPSQAGSSQYIKPVTLSGFQEAPGYISGFNGTWNSLFSGAVGNTGAIFLQFINNTNPDTPILFVGVEIGSSYFVGGDFKDPGDGATMTITSHHGNAVAASERNYTDLYLWLEDESFSDYYSSEVDNTGKVYVQDINAKRRVYKARMRYGGRLFQDSLINLIPSFDFENREDLSDRDNEITRIREIGYTLKVRQRNKNTSILIGRTILKNADGSDNMISSDETLSTFRPSEEIYGSYSPAADMKSVRDGYFFDLTNGVVVRDSPNGMITISGNEESAQDPYKMSRHFRSLAKIIREEGEENFNIIGVWDDSNKLYTLSIQDLRRTDEPTEGIPPVVDREKALVSISQTLVFHEPTNRWKAFMSYVPEWYENIGQTLVSFMDGDLWEHYAGQNFNNFYGVQYPQYFAVVCNIAPDSIKAFNNIDVYSNLLWEAPEITIPPNTLYPNGMLSRLRPGRFVNKEGKFHAQFLRDINTPGQPVPALALQNGRMLRGEAVRVLLKNDHVDLVKLRDVVIHFAKSEKSV